MRWETNRSPCECHNDHITEGTTYQQQSKEKEHPFYECAPAATLIPIQHSSPVCTMALCRTRLHKVSFHKRSHITGVNTKLSCFEHSPHDLPASRLGKGLHEDDLSDYGNRS